MIFTVLIALEFNHSIIGVLERKESIVQVETVILIALLALARKFIILDASKTDAMTIIGLAFAVLAWGRYIGSFAIRTAVRPHSSVQTSDWPGRTKAGFLIFSSAGSGGEVPRAPPLRDDALQPHTEAASNILSPSPVA
jgi:hypothetical protein